MKKTVMTVLIAAGAAGAAAAAGPAGATAGKAAVGADIPAGYRALALPLPGTQLAFVKKGDRVDVLVEFEALMDVKGGDAKEKVAATILQNVVVADVKRPEKLDQTGAVELLLNPNEAQYAALSLEQGSLHLARRAPGDSEMHPMEMATFRKLFK